MRATGKLTRWLAAGLALAPTSVMAQAIWAETPSAVDLGAYVPPKTDGPRDAAARIRCKVAPDGQLSDCEVVSETPAGWGFGAFALTIAPKFRATPEAARKMKGFVVLPIRFGASEAGAPPRREARFQVISGYRGNGVAGPYYPDRALRTGATSIVKVDCRVGDKDQLEACRITDAPNAEYGFGDAVLKMVERRWMTAGPPPEGVTPPDDGIWRFQVVFDAGQTIKAR